MVCVLQHQVPKVGGIKKGWMRQFVVVCDFKLFLYDTYPDRGTQASVLVNQVLDMRSVNGQGHMTRSNMNHKHVYCTDIPYQRRVL